MPTVFSISLAFAWTWIDQDARRVEAYNRLAREDGTSGHNSILLDYSTDFTMVVPLKSALMGHASVFAGSVGALVATWVLVPAQASMIGFSSVTKTGEWKWGHKLLRPPADGSVIELFEHYRGEAISLEVVFAHITLVMLFILLALCLWLLLNSWSRKSKLTSDPGSIESVLKLAANDKRLLNALASTDQCSDAELRDNFEDASLDLDPTNGGIRLVDDFADSTSELGDWSQRRRCLALLRKVSERLHYVCISLFAVAFVTGLVTMVLTYRNMSQEEGRLASTRGSYL